jgi:hypothetical protein
MGRLSDVDKRDRKAVLGQGATRPETPKERRQRAALEADLEGSPLKGRPLRARLRNFRPSEQDYIASLGGPLPWMRRLRQIEDALALHELRLEEAWRELARELAGQPERFGEAWRAVADAWSFDEVNDLIERHNRFFPAEARLPMDPRTRDFVLVNGKPYQRKPLGAEWVLERFPPELALASVAA